MGTESPAPTTSAIEGVLDNAGDVVTSSVGWIGDFLTFITSEGNEILLLFIIIPIVGLGIGLLSRLFSIR